MRRVRNYAGTPDCGHHDQQPRGRTKQKSDHQTARSADDHCRGRHLRAPHPIREPAGHHAADRSTTDDHEGGQLADPRRISTARDALPQHHRHPGPHRVQLPHVAEVAEVGQAYSAIAHDVGDLRQIEGLRRSCVGAVVHEQQDHSAGQDRQERWHSGGDPPVRRAERIDQVGRRLPEGERAYQHTQSESAPLAEPRGDDLHPRRIHAGQADAGQKAEGDGARRAMGRQHQQQIDDASQKCGRSEQGPHVDHIRQIHERAEQRPGHEAQLHCDGEPGGGGGAQPPLRNQRRSHGRHPEPERHRQQLRQRHQHQRACARTHAVASAVPGPEALGPLAGQPRSLTSAKVSSEFA